MTELEVRYMPPTNSTMMNSPWYIYREEEHMWVRIDADSLLKMVMNEELDLHIVTATLHEQSIIMNDLAIWSEMNNPYPEGWGEPKGHGCNG